MIKHLYVKYQVPEFMYKCFDGYHRGSFFHEWSNFYKNWFIIISQGGSFQKEVKGIMTSKEAVMFLNNKKDLEIHMVVWLVKMTAEKIPLSISLKLIDRIFRNFFFDDPNGRCAEAIHFYSKYYKEMDKETFSEVSDFIYHKLLNDNTFSFKGRTITSIIKLSNEWHKLIQKAKLGSYVEWNNELNILDKEYEDKTSIWAVKELATNRELANEGKKQKHCVYGYVEKCISKQSSIFSLRRYNKAHSGYSDEGSAIYVKTEEIDRTTIEVSPRSRTIVQIKKVLNKPPTNEDLFMIKKWAAENGISVQKLRW